MKKFVAFTCMLSLLAAMLMGCGCMNTGKDVPTLPTNGETVTPSTQMTAPTTMPATAPTTEATTSAPAETSTATESTGTLEGAMDDIVGGSTDDTTDATDAADGAGVPGDARSRSRGPMMPRG